MRAEKNVFTEFHKEFLKNILFWIMNIQEEKMQVSYSAWNEENTLITFYPDQPFNPQTLVNLKWNYIHITLYVSSMLLFSKFFSIFH